MEIRFLEKNEWKQALDFLAQNFNQTIGFAYSNAGQNWFYDTLNNIAATINSPDSINDYVIFECRQNEEQAGVSVMTSQGQVLFVVAATNWQRSGIEKSLCVKMSDFLRNQNADLQLVMNVPDKLGGMMRQAGFVPKHERGTWQDMPYVKMVYLINKSIPHKNSSVLVAGIAIFLAALLLIALIFAASIAIKNINKRIIQNGVSIFSDSDDVKTSNESKDEENKKQNSYTNNDDNTTDDTGKISSVNEKMQDINVYEAENLSYSIVNKHYSLDEKSASGDPLKYDIDYPQIEGLPGGKDDTVNKILADNAFYTKNLYDTGKLDTMKKNYGQEFAIDSEVNYIVSYASNNLLSVVYEEDVSYSSNYYTEVLDARSCVINLETGEVYTIPYVLKDSEQLAKSIRTKFMDRYSDFEYLQEIQPYVYQEMLQGNMVEGRYYLSMFLSGDGIQFAFTYHFSNGQVVERGWRIISYKADELKEYKTASPFWDLVEDAGL